MFAITTLARIRAPSDPPKLLLVVVLVAAGASAGSSKQHIPAASEGRVLQKRASTGSRATGPAGEWWKVWWQNYIPEVTDPTAVPHLTTPTPEEYGPDPSSCHPTVRGDDDGEVDCATLLRLAVSTVHTTLRCILVGLRTPP
ncbi:hypothetical protein HPB51_013439 [Rhipicephalus microplus]|uniref:Uncharacterized protein n=1 Tax=Rhipicephalus microplus TaxID=6941 RepID=A0A9J6EGK9_RHIMP|nr:hypothetical protein HPB51_013439 [Rhipicephalus microplus]